MYFLLHSVITCKYKHSTAMNNSLGSCIDLNEIKAIFFMCTPDSFCSKILVLMSQTPQIQPQPRTLRPSLVQGFKYRVLIKNKPNNGVNNTAKHCKTKKNHISSTKWTLKMQTITTSPSYNKHIT